MYAFLSIKRSCCIVMSKVPSNMSQFTMWVCCVVCVFHQACRCIAVLCVLLLLSRALCAECPVASVVSDKSFGTGDRNGLLFLDIIATMILISNVEVDSEW